MIASAIIVQGRIVRAFIRALGMQAENQLREHKGQAPAYIEEAFVRLIAEEGIDENQVIQEARK